MEFGDLPMTVVAILLTVKMFLDHKGEKKNYPYQRSLTENLQAQTNLLTKIHQTCESTNGKAARIEKDVTIIKERQNRRAG